MMKRIFTLIVLSLFCMVGVIAQPKPRVSLIRPTVDKRTELLSIVFRLAGRPEYNDNSFKLYTDRIANHFDKWKEHELIRFSRSLIKTNGISYDAVMSMAVNMDERMNFKGDFSTLDKRWDSLNVRQFNKLLKEFVKESSFEEFYSQNEPLYREAERRFMPIYENVDIKWYSDFYGKESDDRFHIILSMSNGNSNYGSRTNGENGMRNVYSIMGTWGRDSSGMIVYLNDEVFPILIHEFSHSFVNVDYEPFKQSGERIYAIVGQRMARQAYGVWQTMLTEAMVRASVIKYLKDHGASDRIVGHEIAQQKHRGFYWIKALVDEFEKYAASRETYPTFESYLPQLVNVYADFASYVENYDQHRPKIVSINEFADGDTTVNSSIKSITINFDRPLIGRGYSFNMGPLGQQAMPKIDNVRYINDNKTVIIDVTLKPEYQYQIVLLGLSFRTEQGDGMIPYILTFKTVK